MGYRSGFAVNPASAQGQPAQDGGFDAERVALVSLRPPQILAEEPKGNPMRLIVALCVALPLLAAPASAQTVDLATIKCKEFIESGKDNIGVIAMWLHGYYAGKADSNAVINFDKFAKDAEKLGKYCGENPSIGLITASDKILGD
jgi:acid stress chaperone HdeB